MTSENIRIANTPITVVTGSILAKKVSANGILISAKPLKIVARNKKIRVFMVFPPSQWIVRLYVKIVADIHI